MELASRLLGSSWSSDLPDLDSDRTLVLAFGAPELIDATAWEELRRRYPSSHILGCSTAGEIFGGKVSDGTLSVAIARFGSAQLRSASTPIESLGESFQAGQRLAAALDGPGLRAVLVYSDGLGVNGSELVLGLTSRLGPGVIVTGGLAADGDRFRRTWVVDAGRPTLKSIAAVGLYGDGLDVRHASKGGWDIFGVERVVTRSRGNILYELDGKPALQLYKSYLGERASGLPATALLFPLSVREHATSPRSIVRTVLAVNEQDQSMTFAGDVPQGCLAQLMRANFDRLVQGASDAATAVFSRESEVPVLTVAVSCVGRRLVLGERTEEETEATIEALPPSAQQVGFYSYGEIGPHGQGGCDLHNQTMTLTTICER